MAPVVNQPEYETDPIVADRIADCLEEIRRQVNEIAVVNGRGMRNGGLLSRQINILREATYSIQAIPAIEAAVDRKWERRYREGMD